MNEGLSRLSRKKGEKKKNAPPPPIELVYKNNRTLLDGRQFGASSKRLRADKSWAGERPGKEYGNKVEDEGGKKIHTREWRRMHSLIVFECPSLSLCSI